MIISMTGYGNAEFEKDGVSYSAEIRSFNSKFLEISIKLPRVHSQRENEIRELVRKYVNRGKIIVSANLERNASLNLPIDINEETIKYLNQLFKKIKKVTKSKEKIKLDHFLKFSEIFQHKDEEISEIEFQNLYNCVELSIQKLMEMKIQEGKELEKDLLNRIGLIENNVFEIERIWSERAELEFQRLKEKAQKLLEGKDVNEERLELELALLLDKMDITEECVRLKSHIKFFKESIDKNEPSGRRLSFLAQELLREANTISAKSNSAEISQIVVLIKEEIEKIKEQIQNIE
ncbi:MAG: YicC family protein [Ignavibacteria bacterium]|nr:YicC family protein [Ignavibacteria bacterium]MDH7527308.1 YicC family protein [Ignavibacteria bacterium]NPV12005.1 YicC family protein [Ignavibacteria bacterium]